MNIRDRGGDFGGRHCGVASKKREALASLFCGMFAAANSRTAGGVCTFFASAKKVPKKAAPRKTTFSLGILSFAAKVVMKVFVRNLRFLRHSRFADLLRRYKERAPRSSRLSSQKAIHSSTSADCSFEVIFSSHRYGLFAKAYLFLIAAFFHKKDVAF